MQMEFRVEKIKTKKRLTRDVLKRLDWEVRFATKVPVRHLMEDIDGPQLVSLHPGLERL